VRQLRQRISFQYELHGLHRDEMDRYLRHRLAVAGFKGETLFNSGAVNLLHRVTRGTPRLANIIAHKALMLTFAEGRQQVQMRHVRKAAADTPESHRDWMLWVWGIGSVSVIAALAILAISLR
jgi:MSHA biogenesis protein MshM